MFVQRVVLRGDDFKLISGNKDALRRQFKWDVLHITTCFKGFNRVKGLNIQQLTFVLTFQPAVDGHGALSIEFGIGRRESCDELDNLPLLRR